MIPGIVAGHTVRSRSPVVAGIIQGAINLATYNAQLLAPDSGGGKWSVLSGTLPRGLHLNPDTGAIFGVANAGHGYYNAVIKYDGAASIEQSIEIGVGSVACLMHFDGEDGSTVFNDETGRIWMRSGSAAIRTDDKKLGTGALRLSGSQHLYSSGTGFDFGTEDFDMSAFAKFSNATGPYQETIWSKFQGGDLPPRLQFVRRPNGTTGMSFQTGGMPGANAVSIDKVQANKWHFVSAYRRASVAFGGLDGKYGDANTSSLFAQNMTFTAQSAVGCFINAGAPYQGYLQGLVDELCIVIGARINVDGYIPAAPLDYPQPPPPLTISGSLPAGASGAAYNNETGITVSGSPISVFVADGALPSGFSTALLGSKIAVSGPPAAAGDYRFTLTVTDAAGHIAHLPLTLRIV